ncbi:MAG: hypothetical protein ACE5GQ_07280, partial [Nitrospinales bacterium]
MKIIFKLWRRLGEGWRNARALMDQGTMAGRKGFFVQWKYSRWLKTLWVSAGLSALAVAVLTGVGVYNIYHRHIFQSAEDHAVHIGKALVEQEWDNLMTADSKGRLRLAMDEKRLAGFDKRVKKYLSHFQVKKLKIFDLDKKVIYSTDPAIIGRKEDKNGDLDKALRGATISELKTGVDTRHLASERGSHVDLIETYTPMQGSDGKGVGAFELYADVTPYRKDLKEFLTLSVLRVFIVSVLVFGAFLFLVVYMLKIIDFNIRKQRETAKQLEDKTMALESVNEKLRDFTSIASHDLREPLRKVIIFSDRLMSHYAEALDAKGRDCLG